MKLNVHERGDGDKTALLIHGGMSDHRTWHAVEDELIARGYRVIAPDLRGHGLSPRGDYRPESLADDLVESIPAGVDVAIGHSLGGLSLSFAVERLRPARAVYSDPGFRFGHLPANITQFMINMVRTATAESVRKMNPRWSDADVAAELAGFALFDTGFFALTETQEDYLPASAVVPSMVQLADPSFTIDECSAQELRDNGFEIRTVKGAGHCIHRDDYAGFMASLDGWI
ncbi:alpha/beta hydrolase [Streptomyces sp. H10-C2]|uniref:alpha/beta fold hydrolase n=1 Tax=unclassified Streptomyces TaxID=2593676 RepID=UPI0024B91691|nr:MULTISPECIES: alpha/beta hydrolase [unclassified Streptomyces]MDJ0347441.1 alpha/beta hydrolase [Streptomyces sp. PH10-H1]MDJ0375677.1 alpha/beta hydrolase [Streptomyces sp. H10-C2]